MNLRTEKFATKCGIAGLLVFMTLAASASTVQFKPAQSYAVGTNPTSVAVGDLNGDDKPDLAVLNSGSNNVTILLGKGDGTFQCGGSFAAGIPADSTVIPTIAIGDFNGDGKVDLAVLVPPDGNTAPGEVHILMGNGDGTLQAPIVMTLEPNVTVVAVADFNGDKKADLVANLSDGSGNATGVEVLLGNGGGTFQTPKTVVTGQQSAITVADLNNDGMPDLVISSSNTVQILLGQGDGVFSPGGQAVLTAQFSGTAAWAADLSGDGNLALIVESSFFHAAGFNVDDQQHVSVFLRDGSGRFGAEQVVLTGAEFATELGLESNTLLTDVAIGDFNGDGNLDIVARANNYVRSKSNGIVSEVAFGDGTGKFVAYVSPGDPGPGLSAADLNGDQLTDFIVLDSANNSIDVILNANPAFAMSASTMSLTATAGEQVTDTLSLTGVNGFSSSLQLSCHVTGPAPAPTCSLSPASITAGASASTSTLTIEVPTTAALVSPHTRLLPPVYALALPFAFVGLGFRRKRVDPRYKLRLLTASLATAALMCAACGGGSSNTQSVHQPQSYTVQVTAASDSLTKAMQISLTVQ